METNFDSFVTNLLEMAATFKDAGDVKQTISDIKSKNLPHHYQKPLVAIADEADRNEMIDRIISKVFGNENHNSDINTKKELQDALEKAVIAVSREPDSKFARPVQGVAANYLGRWLGTNINVEYTRSGDTELENKGASVTAAKEVLNKTLTPTHNETPELSTNEEPKSQAEEPASSGSTIDYSKVLEQEHTFTERALDVLSAKLEPINRKLKKNQLAPIEVKTLRETFERHRKDDSIVKLINFKLIIPPLVLPGGWKFVARIDHEPGGNIIVGAPNSGHERDLHSMYGKAQASYCDHCKTTRARTSTFIIENDKGELKRIGRQCLKNYLQNSQAVDRIVEIAQYLSSLALGIIEAEERQYDDDGGEGGGSGGGGPGKYSEAKEALGMGLCIVKRFGYVSNSKATESYDHDTSVVSTSNRVMFALYDRHEDAQAIRELYGEKQEEYRKQAEEIIDWGVKDVEKQLEEKGPSSYLNNLLGILKTAKDHNVVQTKYIAYLLSVIPSYQRNKEEAAAPKEAQKESNYVGKEGYPIGELSVTDRRKLKKDGIDMDNFPFNGPIPVTVKMAKSYQLQSFGYGSGGGTGTILNLIDKNGNVYVIFAGYQVDVNPGDKMLIKRALVKSHQDYTNKAGKTIKQTKLIRVDFGSPEEEEQFKNQEVETNESFEEFYKQTLEEKSPCWKGYKQVGTKKKGKKEVPNCVPTKN